MCRKERKKGIYSTTNHHKSEHPSQVVKQKKQQQVTVKVEGGQDRTMCINKSSRNWSKRKKRRITGLVSRYCTISRFTSFIFLTMSKI